MFSLFFVFFSFYVSIICVKGIINLLHRWWLHPSNQKMLAPWKKSCDKPRQNIKKQEHHFADKGLSSQRHRFSSSYVQMWQLDHKEGWAPKSWSFWTVVLEKTLESPLDSKEIKPVNPKGNQSWLFIGRTVTEAEARILRPPDVKSWLMRKDSDVGENWGQEEKGMTEDEMAGWHHWLDGREYGWTPGVQPNPCPLSWWCHPTISSSVIPFSSCPQFFPASGSFQMSQLFASGGQSIGVSASASLLPMNTQDCPLGWTGWISLQSN